MARTSSSGSKPLTLSASAAVAAYAANPAMAPVGISDSCANFTKCIDALCPLALNGKILTLRLTDTASIAITAGQYKADASVIAFLPAQRLLVVTGVAAADASTLQADARVKSFRITDSTANIADRLDALNSHTLLTAITLTDAAPIGMTHGQLLADTTVLAKLPAGATYLVRDVGATAAATVQAHAKVVSFGVRDTATAVTTAATALNTAGKLSAVAVQDTAANLLAQLSNLNGISKLGVITVTDTDTLAIDAVRYLTHTATLAKLATGEAISVSGAAVSDLATIAADPRVIAMTVADTIARIQADLPTLNALAVAGTLVGITVLDPGNRIVLSAAEQAAYADVLPLLTGFVTEATPPARPPVINLIWDESVALAPAGFKPAIEYAARFFDTLITSPITVNIEVGWGEARDTALAAGLLGEAYVTTGVFRSFADYRADLLDHSTSAPMQTAIENLQDPGKQIFIAGAQAKALGRIAADATARDGAIGFATDPTGDRYTYDPNNRAVPGKVDLIGLAQHEITHALGRISYTWATTGFDLYRYSAPGTWAAASSGATYFSIDGGTTNLGAFSTTGDPADWDHTQADDAQAAFLGTGIAFDYDEADIIALNALGYAIRTDALPALPGSAGDAVIDPLAGGSAAHMAFLEPDHVARPNGPGWQASPPGLADVVPALIAAAGPGPDDPHAVPAIGSAALLFAATLEHHAWLAGGETF